MYRVSNKNISLVAFLYFMLRFVDLFLPVSKIYILLFTFVEAIPFLWFILDRQKLSLKAFYVISMGMLFVIFSMIVAEEVYISEMMFTLLGIWFGYHLSEQGMDRHLAFRLFLIYLVVIVIRFAMTGSGNQVFITSSRNTISAVLILASVLYYSSFAEGESIPLLPATVTFLMSCIAQGRGGIISSAVLLLGVVLYDCLCAHTMSFKKVLVLAVFIAVVYLVYTRCYDLIFKQAMVRLFSENLMDNERIKYGNEYIAFMRTSWKYFLFGVSKNMLPSIMYLGGNFHNSYLGLHSVSGIGGCIIIFVLVLKSVVRSLRNRNFIRMLLLVVILFRMLTDILCFVGLYDPLFYYVIFLCLKKKQRYSRGGDGGIKQNASADIVSKPVI